jgi:glutamate-ammonia-ligase adenylyltransferase
VTSSSRATASRAARLARLGFADSAQADRLLDDPALAGLVDPFDDVFGDGVVDAMGAVADPDLALLGLVRLMEALRRLDDEGQHSVRDLVATLRHRGPGQDRLLAVLGSSVALANHLVNHPEHWSSVTTAARRTPE